MQNKIPSIKKELMELGDLRPGALSEQYNVCGNPNCRCKDKNDPKKHGPYYQLSYSYKGKSKTEFVRQQDADEVRTQIANHRRLKELVEEWIEESLRIAKQKKEELKAASGKSPIKTRKKEK